MKIKFFSILFSLLVLVGCSSAAPNSFTDDTDSGSAEQDVVELDDTLDTVINREENEIETETTTTEVANTEDISAETQLVNPQLERMKVHYIDVGQADATLLEFSQGDEDFHILIDAGNWNTTDVVTYLKQHNITHIDILMGTHPHADHIGQIDKIIETLVVDEVWLAGETATSQIFSRMLDAIETNDVGYYEPRTGDVFDVGPLVIEILNPTELTGDVHSSSLSMKMTYGDVAFIFTGDAEVDVERAILNKGFDVHANFLKLGHHGSKTSTSQEFLNAVDPEVAIISAGIDSQYGHPHAEVVERVQSKGIDVYATATQGTIVVSTNGQTYDIETFKTTKAPVVAPNKSSATTVQKPVTEKEPAPSNCVDINIATYEQLQQIKHIGPVRAQDLIALRPFNNVNDLNRIKGIGPSRIADIIAQGLACTGG
ncbi:MBL fold metallo-hydrolase [Sporosarcina oncorhynchi]|uniref:MBL fold metallo-hydrolase n=1 Tax=Sporosarcina oncorhynchi TaxID=3056444 RepID=A0ABZ0L5A5_9BACL|nr:MBL fold metallo-hydrolase [Sporosarcina sp. T2O-4]WOV86832.1 MBL fold metallo-hydrolase [Sporosarcina sp. T2O-4]